MGTLDGRIIRNDLFVGVIIVFCVGLVFEMVWSGFMAQTIPLRYWLTGGLLLGVYNVYQNN